MKIVAYLNSEEGGCDYTGHFRKYWVENNTLHPKAKNTPIEIKKTLDAPMVMLLDSEDQPLLIQKGNEIDPSKLQEFILIYHG